MRATTRLVLCCRTRKLTADVRRARDDNFRRVPHSVQSATQLAPTPLSHVRHRLRPALTPSASPPGGAGGAGAGSAVQGAGAGCEAVSACLRASAYRHCSSPGRRSVSLPPSAASAPPSRRVRPNLDAEGGVQGAGRRQTVRRRVPAMTNTTTAPRQGGGPSRLRRPPPRCRQQMALLRLSLRRASPRREGITRPATAASGVLGAMRSTYRHSAAGCRLEPHRRRRPRTTRLSSQISSSAVRRHPPSPPSPPPPPAHQDQGATTLPPRSRRRRRRHPRRHVRLEPYRLQCACWQCMPPPVVRVSRLWRGCGVWALLCRYPAVSSADFTAGREGVGGE